MSRSDSQVVTRLQREAWIVLLVALVVSSSLSAHIEWRAPIEVATGAGKAGPWRMNESVFHYVDDASVALRDDGEVAIVWVDNRRQDVFLQRYSPDDQPRFKDPVNVSRSSGIFSWLPRVEFGENERLYLVWQEIVFSGGSHGGEIYFARSTDGGLMFDEPINLSETTHGAGKGRLTGERWDNGSFDVALGPQGEIVVVWTEYEGPLRMRRSIDGGQSFSKAQQVGGNSTRPARGPSLAMGSGRTIFLAWTVGEDQQADIQVAKSTDNGRSFDSIALSQANEGRADAPDILVDGEGDLLLVFEEHARPASASSRLRFARLAAAADVWNEIRRPVSDSAGSEYKSAPLLGSDGSGRVYLLWEHHLDPRGPARGLGISVSEDGGESFRAPRHVPGSRDERGGVNGSRQGKFAEKLAVNRAGGIAVVNSHFLEGQNSRIVLIRGQER